ncbi:MurR/RpiR family transcriptional regulator [Lactobacillus sp. YT155]|uniref:MurR/RpiR family transcriptional regulator n=1 Tax=Lactobacillus sp. YT155 TaxID=3060955 RepID=UPI00265DC1D5|nr:MurR/RpiR family transcriptional regulator [Lactobacillus sp. YT155]MDO1605661.1 MurR/RpiR family transcriptional regulator [Lactobacillus sp. YT155]
MNIAYLIKEKYPSLTKSEKKIADYILKNLKNIPYSTMSDLKDATNVGDATIIRFCQKLDFNGFSDLKIEVAKDEYSKKEELSSQETYFDINADNLKNSISRTRELIIEDNIINAVDFISKASKVYIFGVGSSGNTCAEFASMLLRVGVIAEPVTDPHFQAQVASLLSKDDLVIGFSLSGKTKDTFDSLNIAKQNNAKIISITNYLTSPIAEMSDIVLQTAVEEFLNGGSLAGKISQLYVSELLVTGYEKVNEIDSLKLREKVLRSIIDKTID